MSRLKYYYLNEFGRVMSGIDNGNAAKLRKREIGNYFETREEAEKAIHKLEAFRRLKAKGFQLYGSPKGNCLSFEFTKNPKTYEIITDLTYLFAKEKE